MAEGRDPHSPGEGRPARHPAGSGLVHLPCLMVSYSLHRNGCFDGLNQQFLRNAVLESCLFEMRDHWSNMAGTLLFCLLLDS